jgi:hypothetical protein
VIDNTAEMTPSTWFDIGSPSLWHQTHLQFMRLYEEDELPSLWKKRIEKASRRLGANAWVSQRSGLQQIPSRWQAPFYWDPAGGGESSAPAPKALGPNACLYGSPPDELGALENLSQGIGYGKFWKNIP